MSLWSLGCAEPPDKVEPRPEPVDDTDVVVIVEPDPVQVQITPTTTWGGEPLRCESTRAEATLAWQKDGAPWEGALTTTSPGDTVPAVAQTAGQTWTCVATTPDSAAEVSVVVRAPNVLLLLADDLGHGDLGTYGGPTPTPRLDTLAAQGVRFTDAYAAAPVCGPSRAGLLTARQPSRFGFEYNVYDDATGAERGLPAGEVTLGDRLQAAHYETALFGKWHLGFGPVFHPNLHGFDHFFGFLNGRRPSLEPGLPGLGEYDVNEQEAEEWPAARGGWMVEENGVPVTLDDRHLTDRLADETIAWMAEEREAPFFAMLSFNAVHVPLQATAEQLALVEPSDGPSWVYRANVAVMDRAIGRVLDALEAQGIAEHTVVIFASDNGCPSVNGFCSNAPFAGGKVLLTEGGLRVPMILRWPDRLAAGEQRSDMVSLLDLAPTLIAAAGGAITDVPIDGVDLLPWLRGLTDAPPHEALYWRMLPVRAIRRGVDKRVDSIAGVWRFDLGDDPGEQHNLIREDPALARALADELDARTPLYVGPAWLGQVIDVDYYGVPLTVAY